MNYKSLRQAVWLAFGLFIMAPAALADLSRSVTVNFCNNTVRGSCKAAKDADDPFTRVLFKCKVLSFDHSPNHMDSANMDAQMLKTVKSSVTQTKPTPGPLHGWHQYCRAMTGVYPHEKIRFFPTPTFYKASLPDAMKCILRKGDGYQP